MVSCADASPRLGAVGLSDWLHVLRPSPARLERAFEDGCAIEIDEISVALIDELTFLVGCVHLLDVESGHFRPPGSVVGSVAIHSQRYRNVNRKDQLFAYLRTVIEKQLLKDVACAGRGSSGCERDARHGGGERRARP